jgi:hypothetical protein
VCATVDASASHLVSLRAVVVVGSRVQKALADYLDGKRRIFPRFYFVSEADLLDILSNGNTPSRIIHHITKVLLATSTLELDESKGGRPYAKKFISAVGVEEVALNPHVQLEGKVENYLQFVLDAQRKALRDAVKVRACVRLCVLCVSVSLCLCVSVSLCACVPLSSLRH